MIVTGSLYVFTDPKDAKGKTTVACTKEKITYWPCQEEGCGAYAHSQEQRFTCKTNPET